MNGELALASAKKRLQSTATKELYGMSELQQKILKLVCENRDADYSYLSSKLEHDRIIVLRSVHSLERRKMLIRKKAEPNNPRTRLMFEPTHKGATLAVLFLDVSLDKFKYIHDLEGFVQLKTEIKDKIFRKKFIVNLLRYFVENDLFDSEGRYRSLNSKETKSAIYYMLDQIFTTQLTSESIRDLDKIFGKEMMLRMKIFYEKLYDISGRFLEEFKKMGYD
jgi:predicted transcriptional regulator